MHMFEKACGSWNYLVRVPDVLGSIKHVATGTSSALDLPDERDRDVSQWLGVWRVDERCQ